MTDWLMLFSESFLDKKEKEAGEQGEGTYQFQMFTMSTEEASVVKRQKSLLENIFWICYKELSLFI